MKSKCVKCGQMYSKPRVGRGSDVCPRCYPKYRQAVSLFHSAKHRAKEKNLQFDLTVDWIFERLDRCLITGLTFVSNPRSSNYKDRHPLTASVDRIKPELGYVKENCRLVIWWFNVAKQMYSDVEVWHLCELVARSLDVSRVLAAEPKEEITAAII